MIPSDLSPDFFRILTALTKLVVLAMLLERALVLLFDYRWFREKIGSLGFKSPIAFIVSWAVCGFYKFDVLGALFEGNKTSSMGIFVTAAIVAGGSAGAITLRSPEGTKRRRTRGGEGPKGRGGSAREEDDDHLTSHYLTLYRASLEKIGFNL